MSPGVPFLPSTPGSPIIPGRPSSPGLPGMPFAPGSPYRKFHEDRDGRVSESAEFSSLNVTDIVNQMF